MKKSKFEERELLDFLAELALEIGNSISYFSFSNKIGLIVSTNHEETKKELFIPLEQSEISAEVPRLKFLAAQYDIKIPVLKEAEQEAVLEALRQIKQSRVRIYRLSFHERYRFFSRKFISNYGAYKTASVENSLQM